MKYLGGDIVDSTLLTNENRSPYCQLCLACVFLLPTSAYAQSNLVGGTFTIGIEETIPIYGQRSVDCGVNPPWFGWILTWAVSKKPEYGDLSDGGTGERFSGKCGKTVPVRVVNYTPDKEKVLERAENEKKNIVKDRVVFWESDSNSATIYIKLSSSSVTNVSIPQKGAWDGESPVDIPKMEVGDTWAYEGYSSKFGSDNFTEEVVGSGEGHFLLSHVAEKADIDRVWTIEQRKSYPRMKLIEGLEFPLYVGKKWKIEYEGKSVENQFERYINKYKVQKVELKSVKAGKFRAFKIKMTQKVVGGIGRPGNKYIWYAPAVKRIILTKPSWRKGEELVSYELYGPE